MIRKCENGHETLFPARCPVCKAESVRMEKIMSDRKANNRKSNPVQMKTYAIGSNGLAVDVWLKRTFRWRKNDSLLVVMGRDELQALAKLWEEMR